MRVGEDEGTIESTIVGDVLGLGEGMALLCTEGMMDGRLLGPEVGIDVGDEDGA